MRSFGPSLVADLQVTFEKSEFLVLNLRDAPAPAGFERVLEVVPADDSARGPLRERWKQYVARGHDVKKHDM